MGGIAGIWGRNDPELVRWMSGRLTHRGPDSLGTHHGVDPPVDLGYTRLAVTDIGGGDQPMYSPSGNVLVANSEICNAGMLRGLLGPHRFASRSDSEAILHLLGDEGCGATSRLRGFFAFAMLLEGDLVLGRDPFGIKPLYLADHEGALVFASELKALPDGVTEVRELEPGTVFSAASGLHRYFTLHRQRPLNGSFETHAARVRRALERAVRLRLASDVPVGAFLSGSLGDSAVAALMSRYTGELHTFSVGLAGSRELWAARRVSAHLGTIHHEHVLEPAEVLEELPTVVESLEAFGRDLVRAAVPMHFAARLASRHVKVVLTGVGADALFAGQERHRGIDDPEVLDNAVVESLRSLHDVELRRLDHLTMARGVEARVPLLDLDVVAAALSVPIELRRPGFCSGDKAVLRSAVADLLPHDVTWRDEAGAGGDPGPWDSLWEQVASVIGDTTREHPGPCRSAEECHYHAILGAALGDLDPLMTAISH
ncbi:MAG: asparagine synthase-related protein [Microthrixaceae bacterium]|nr:hypothetical protein [Microthrixaceae bacterium]MCO5319294.1 asparagine synthase-related protein [Microthrixaceae bacterium]